MRRRWCELGLKQASLRAAWPEAMHAPEGRRGIISLSTAAVQNH